MLLIIAACGTSKKVISTNLHEITRETSNTELDITQVISTAMTTIEREAGNVSIYFTLYDTSKPTDSITGKPPVSADGELQGSYTKDKQTNASVVDSAAISATQTDNSSKETVDKTETAAERKETTVPRQIGWMCAGFALMIVVIWLLCKKFHIC